MEVISPVAKLLACGDYGVGALADVKEVCSVLSNQIAKWKEVSVSCDSGESGGCGGVADTSDFHTEAVDYREYRCNMCKATVNLCGDSSTLAIRNALAVDTSGNSSALTASSQTIGTYFRHLRTVISHRYVKYAAFYLAGVFSSVALMSIPWWCMEVSSFCGDKFVDM